MENINSEKTKFIKIISYSINEFLLIKKSNNNSLKDKFFVENENKD